MPKMAVSVVPLAATAAAQRVRFSTRARSIRRRSATSARAIALRSRSTTAPGRMWPRSSEARAADSSVGAPPGRRSRSRRWSRLTTRRRSPVSSSRRSDRSRSTALWSSGADAAQVGLALGHPSPRWRHRCRRSCARGPERAGEPGQPASRARRAPSPRVATSCCARRWPRPVAPSTAQIRSGQRSAQRRSRSRVAWFARHRSSPWTRPPRIERDGGVRRLVGIDADRDHLVPPRSCPDDGAPRRAT